MTDRKTRPWCALALLGCATLWSVAGRAEQLLVSTPLVVGSLASDTAFSVSGAGTVTVILSDLGWPDKLASLTFAATTPSAVLANMTGTGEISFQVSGAGIYNAVVGAVASPGFLDLGWYSMTIDFAPAVPLPASGLLLLAALSAVALAWRRRAAPLLSRAESARC